MYFVTCHPFFELLLLLPHFLHVVLLIGAVTGSMLWPSFSHMLIYFYFVHLVLSFPHNFLQGKKNTSS